ncbi:MAG: aminoglycoside phosphotransferase family protein [Gemmatimonadota bacterium]
MNLDKKSLQPYLHRKKVLAQAEHVVDAQPLGSGAKNTIYLVQSEDKRLVVKQAHAKAQTKERWWLDRKRVFQEKACIEILATLVPPDVIPEVLLEDRTNFVLVTNAPPRDAILWEDELATGRIDLQIAAQCGELLATVHNQTHNVREIKALFKDTKAFEQLRLEPLYGDTAGRYPDLKKLIEAQGKDLIKVAHTLVLGDLRPRNVWTNGGQLYLVDFTAAHFGSPSFDLAFYAADLCLKAMLNSPQKAAFLEAINVFWMAYFRTAEYPKAAEAERTAVRDFGCLLLSTTGGRLPPLEMDDQMRDLTYRLAQNLLFTELDKIEDITEFINRTLIDG